VYRIFVAGIMHFFLFRNTARLGPFGYKCQSLRPLLITNSYGCGYKMALSAKLNIVMFNNPYIFLIAHFNLPTFRVYLIFVAGHLVKPEAIVFFFSYYGSAGVGVRVGVVGVVVVVVVGVGVVIVGASGLLCSTL